MTKTKVAILGSGNIGTDLMIKIIKRSESLELAALVGIDAESTGLALAREHGIPTTHKGIDGLTQLPGYCDIELVFDATSAKAHHFHHQVLSGHDKVIIDLTPAAIGPFVVPHVNLMEHITKPNLNMVTCGGQATIPIVAAIREVCTELVYGEIVASISSKSAGPGTRANIDEFTETTSKAIETIGGAQQGKAIIILNPADPPIIMRDTVFTLSVGANPDDIQKSVEEMVSRVQVHVPGYRLKQDIQFEHFDSNNPIKIPNLEDIYGLKTTVFLEVEGAGDYLPTYAGNLDIMTSAALLTAEKYVEARRAQI